MTGRQYIAFLRAVNVGGRIVKMVDLKRVFERLGFDDVATFIASGNVIFTSAANDTARLEGQIESGLHKALEFTVGTLLRTTGEVAAVAEYEPFSRMATEGASMYVGFLKAAPPADAIKRILGFRTETDDLRVEGRHVYWLARTSILESLVSGAAIEKTLKMPATFRNINTVRRLAAKYPPPASTASR